ncbi:MAG: S16 family serine protease, partial [Bacteroidota bacterium]
SLASAFTQRKIRKKMAMTGEITLRGKVLPVGGIKEKILAARRAGVTDIILSADNLKDVEEIPAMYLKGLKFHYVKEMIEVLNNALLNEKVRDAVKIDIPKIASNMITEVSESRKPKIAAKAKRK